MWWGTETVPGEDLAMFPSQYFCHKRPFLFTDQPQTRWAEIPLNLVLLERKQWANVANSHQGYI